MVFNGRRMDSPWRGMQRCATWPGPELIRGGDAWKMLVQDGLHSFHPIFDCCRASEDPLPPALFSCISGRLAKQNFRLRTLFQDLERKHILPSQMCTPFLIMVTLCQWTWEAKCQHKPRPKTVKAQKQTLLGMASAIFCSAPMAADLWAPMSSSSH